MNHFPFQFVDLTHTLSSTSPSWEGECGFTLDTIVDYETCHTEVKFRVQQMHLQCGMGTHMDAPAHCVPHEKTIDTLTLDTLIVPCVVIDISAKTTEVAFQLSVKDIQAFETLYGAIAEKSFVLIYTGWDRFWNNKDQYRAEGNFPSVSHEAARYLLTKNIIGLGI